jgi:Domain of unknown function DUF29
VSARSAHELYEDDFYAWTQLQAKELRRFARTRPNLPLDLRHIADEIADLGTERRNAVRSWTARVIEHLLLLEHSLGKEPRRGWINEVVTLRRDIERRLTPVLRRDLMRHLQRRYDEARSDLVRKLTLYGEADVANRLPVTCPYTLDQVLGDFWPAPHRNGDASS